MWLRERVRRHRVDLERLRTVAVAEARGGDRHRAAAAAARIGEECGGLAGEHEGQIVLLATSEDPLGAGRQLHAALQGVVEQATVGVTRLPAATTADLARGWREAHGCVRTLLTLGRAGEVSDAAGLGLARLVLGENGPAELREYQAGTLGPLLDYDAERGTDLVGTLEAWFAAGGRAGRAAEALHVHPNTVAQRLDRIGTLLGEGWREPGRALELQVALRLWRLGRG